MIERRKESDTSLGIDSAPPLSLASSYSPDTPFILRSLYSFKFLDSRDADHIGVLHNQKPGERAHVHTITYLQRLRMARHCVLGIKALHDANIIHRDIKSKNILVTSDYSCKITDMGCAKLVNSNTRRTVQNMTYKGPFNFPSSLPPSFLSFSFCLFESTPVMHTHYLTLNDRDSSMDGPRNAQEGCLWIPRRRVQPRCGPL